MNIKSWKKLDKKIFVYHLINLGITATFFVPAYKEATSIFKISKEHHLLVFGVLFILTIIIAIHSFIESFSIRYCLNSEQLIIHKGIFITKHLELNHENCSISLSNFRIKQTWIHRLLNIYELELLFKNNEDSIVQLNALNQQSITELKN
jgi:uncharacterized membrane protein YdbT with pleckstrin-like domain